MIGHIKKNYITLFIITILFNANILLNDFVWEDYKLIIQNPTIHSLTKIKNIFNPLSSNFTETNLLDSYRPIRDISFLFDYQLYGTHPFGYHLTNILIHSANVMLLFYLLYKLLGVNYITSLFVSILFGIHPINVHTLSYIKNRSDILMLLFLLFSIINFIQFYGERRKRNYFVSLLFLFLSLQSKEMAITFPFIIIILLYFAGDYSITKDNTKEIIKYLSPYIVMILLIIGLDLYYLSSNKYQGYEYIINKYSPQAYSLENETILSKIYTQTLIVCRYIRELFFPYGLVADYFINITRTISVKVILSISFIIGMIYIGVKTITKRDIIGFGIMWFMITLIPVLNIKPLIRMMSDNYLYLPSIGIYILLGAFVYRIIILVQKKKKHFTITVYSLIALIILGLGIITINHSSNYRNNRVLWTYNIKHNPGPRAYMALAYQHYNKKDYTGYFKAAKKALVLDKYHLPMQLDLLQKYIQFHRYSEAEHFVIQQLAKPLITDNIKSVMLTLLGNIYFQDNRFDSALTAYEKSIMLNNKNINSIKRSIELIVKNSSTFSDTTMGTIMKYYQYGNSVLPEEFTNPYKSIAAIYYKNKSYLQSMLYLQKAIDYDTQDIDLYLSYTDIAIQLKKTNNAVKILLSGIEINPKSTRLFNRLGKVYEQKQQYKMAIRYYKSSISINKKQPEILTRLSDIFRQQKDYQSGLQYANEALEYDSNLIHGILSQAKVLLYLGNLDEALYNLGYIILNYDRDNLFVKETRQIIKFILEENISYIIDKIKNHVIYNGSKYTDIKGIIYAVQSDSVPDAFKYAFNLYRDKSYDTTLSNMNPYLNIARIWLALGNTSNAYKLYLYSLDKYPNDFYSYYNFARFCQKTNMPFSQKIYEYCLRLKPDDPGILIRLSNIYYSKKLYNKALKLYQKYQKNNKSTSDILFRLGKIYEFNNQPYFALEYYNETILYDPAYAEAYLSKSRLLIDFGSIDQAIQIYRYIVNNFKNDKQILKKAKETLIIYEMN